MTMRRAKKVWAEQAIEQSPSERAIERRCCVCTGVNRGRNRLKVLPCCSLDVCTGCADTWWMTQVKGEFGDCTLIRCPSCNTALSYDALRAARLATATFLKKLACAEARQALGSELDFLSCPACSAAGWVEKTCKQVSCLECFRSFTTEAPNARASGLKAYLWKAFFTKPCPYCGVAISKNGGCHHMRCAHCHTSFSWNVVYNPDIIVIGFVMSALLASLFPGAVEAVVSKGYSVGSFCFSWAWWALTWVQWLSPLWLMIATSMHLFHLVHLAKRRNMRTTRGVRDFALEFIPMPFLLFATFLSFNPLHWPLVPAAWWVLNAATFVARVAPLGFLVIFLGARQFDNLQRARAVAPKKSAPGGRQPLLTKTDALYLLAAVSILPNSPFTITQIWHASQSGLGLLRAAASSAASSLWSLLLPHLPARASVAASVAALIPRPIVALLRGSGMCPAVR
eukprot:CAMPEP_0114550556 /NCGR_PEP_ID=MMETSP0114-20121206/6135_1 /TAXON_ID=31324 /ORGANISM="Goniomonas sp, Strain m" /LENGTH=453 /DNA_ID=CAMNT_0001735335 /DNA_START=33 /DNA_END=1394 /DNA_ORIENTATION=-